MSRDHVRTCQRRFGTTTAGAGFRHKIRNRLSIITATTVKGLRHPDTIAVPIHKTTGLPDRGAPTAGTTPAMTTAGQTHAAVRLLHILHQEAPAQKRAQTRTPVAVAEEAGINL